MENLDDELLDEELSDFFKDEDSKEEQKKEEDADLANQKVAELLDTFNVKKNFNEIATIKDAKDFTAMTDKIKANLSSLDFLAKNPYGEKNPKADDYYNDFYRFTLTGEL